MFLCFFHYNIYVLFLTGEEIIYTRPCFDEAIDDTARSFNITGLISGTIYKVSITAVSEALVSSSLPCPSTNHLQYRHGQRFCLGLFVEYSMACSEKDYILG